MRCAPVALRFRTQSNRLRDCSIDVARITHANPLCTWSSVAVNQTIAALLNGASIQQAMDGSTDGIENLDVRAAIERARTSHRDAIASGGYVLDTLAAALWSLLRTDSFEESVVIAVGLGGDTDTTAAVAGALAGAHYGYGAIPDRWRNAVQHGDELATLAGRLLELSEGSSPTH
jgi:ADP-ribosyl-[dinitrogen reductase] hydrolase